MIISAIYSIIIAIALLFLGVIILLTFIKFFTKRPFLPTRKNINSISNKAQRKVAIWGIAVGCAFGIISRGLLFYSEQEINQILFNLFGLSNSYRVMTFSFIFITPFLLGAITVLVEKKNNEIGLLTALSLPWIAASLCLGSIFLFAWEGLICIVLFYPLFLFTASLGGFIAWLIPRNFIYLNLKNSFSFLLFPILISPLEGLLEPPTEFTTSHSKVVVSASREKVWDLIRSVRKIESYEHSFNIIHLIGFPRPIEAVLHGEGQGAVRKASFERNLIFTEEVTEWIEEEKISFSIKANTEEIPPTTLDEHVTIGGPYFDVLNGTYELKDLGNGKIEISLYSNFRVRTQFNWYANLVADYIMTNIQDYILEIIAKRAES